MADKTKKPGEENILSKKELIVQKLSSESKTTIMKFTRESPREFVEYDYDEILPENIKQAWAQHFKEKRNCDVLASEQGPSCTRLDRLPSLNLILIRFTTPTSINNNDSASESWTLPPPMEKRENIWKQSNWEKIFHSQKFICYRYEETATTYLKQGKKFCKIFDPEVQYGK